jgi:ubiquinone/menaquinone biosynthesis C-methylase UbiE
MEVSMKSHTHVIGKQDGIGGTAVHPPQTKGSLIRWAHSYDRWVQVMTLGQARVIRQKTADLAQIKPGNRVLDVGCGTGELTIQAKARAGSTGDVNGIDASPEMIGTAQQKVAQSGAGINFQIGLIEDIPFPADYFDVVLSSLMMHHLPDELKLRGAAEIFRVLKPGGTLLVVDFKRPVSFLSRTVLTVLFHGGLQGGIEDVAIKVEKAGFSQVKTGHLSNLPSLGYLRAQAVK